MHYHSSATSVSPTGPHNDVNDANTSSTVGRKPLLVILLSLFFLGNLEASISQNVGTLIAFRALGGVGGGGLMTVAQIIVSDVVPLRERGRWQGPGAMVAVANGVSPLIGGAFATHASWRWIFWFNLPTTACGILASWKVLPLKKVEGDWKAKLLAIDWFGGLLSLLSATLLVVSGDHLIPAFVR